MRFFGYEKQGNTGMLHPNKKITPQKAPPTPAIVYRQSPDLRNMLVKPKLPEPSTYKQSLPPPTPPTLPIGYFPCNEKKCKTCHITLTSGSFSSSCHNKDYRIQGHQMCNSENLIYQLQCTRKNLHKKLIGQRCDVKTNKEKPGANHAN